MQKGIDALRRLQEGNQRFVANIRADHALQTSRQQTVGGQTPFAIILGCSDSRVPAELIFDQGLGDLFVIRVAGNVVAPSQVGSVEFAADQFSTPLVVVLGHTNCGAVHATIEELHTSVANRSPNLRAIVDRIRPAVEPLIADDADATDERYRSSLLDRATRANIRASADHLRHGSQIIEGLIAHNELLVVGAQYSLESGEVEFFDGLPDGW